MRLAELPHEQQVALVALLERVTMADGVVTEEEEDEIGHVAEEFGDELYRELVDEADEVFTSAKALKAFLQTVHEPEAQELIYGTVLEESITRAPPSQAGSEMLEWMTKAWDIHVAVPPEEEEEEESVQ